jgi:hypothetical protein
MIDRKVSYAMFEQRFKDVNCTLLYRLADIKAELLALAGDDETLCADINSVCSKALIILSGDVMERILPGIKQDLFYDKPKQPLQGALWKLPKRKSRKPKVTHSLN